MMDIFRRIKRGATKKSIFVYLTTTSAEGVITPKTGLAYNSAGIVLSYARVRSARVAITPADLAAITTAWTSGGFKEVDAANMPGVYRLDVPDAAFAVGADVDAVVVSLKFDNTDAKNVLIALHDDPEDYTGWTSDTVRANS